MCKTDGRGSSTGLIRVSKMQQLVPRLFCFDSPSLVAARLPQKTVNYGIRRPDCSMRPGQSTNTRSRIGQCTREGNQFTIYRGTRFKSAFYGVTCDGHVEVDKGVRSTLNWGGGRAWNENEGWSWFFSSHAPEKKMMLNELRMPRPKSTG